MYGKLFLSIIFLGVAQLTHAFSGNNHPQPSSERLTKVAQDGRPALLWFYYMNGVSDEKARMIDLEKAFDEAGIKQFTPVEIRIRYGNWKQQAIHVKGDTKVVSNRSVINDIKALRRKKIRIFTWVSGEETGRRNSPNSYSDPANIGVIIRDVKGNQLSETNTIVIGTSGTYPWHCYHIEVHIPEEASSIHLVYSNNYGDVWFARPSWEVITKDNQYSNWDRQDPVSGSTASNVYYDEMNRQFARGWPSRYTWNYFKGSDIGLIGQAYNITTVEGLKRYFYDKVKTDNDHMNHSLMYFASRYLRGKEAGVLPEGMDDEWFQALTKLVIDDQDKATGYWGTYSDPVSMGITFHFVDGLFAYYGIQRADTPQKFNPLRHLAVKEIPRAEEIAQTTLKMQSDRRDGTGKAGWPRIAYNYTDTPNKGEQRCSLVVTNNAIALLRSCEQFVGAKTKVQIYDSIKSAMRYILEECVQSNGVWLQSDTASAPSTSFYMHRILSQSHYLERKVTTEVAPPDIQINRAENNDVILKANFGKDHNSYRIYKVKTGTPVEELSENDLIVIMHFKGANIYEQDPLVVVNQMARALNERWGQSWPPNTYQGQKAKIVSSGVELLYDNASYRLKPVHGYTYYAAAVTWYGEESYPVKLGEGKVLSPFQVINADDVR